ncbi:MAG: hypothetical protein ACREOO_12015 [bacterium]
MQKGGSRRMQIFLGAFWVATLSPLLPAQEAVRVQISAKVSHDEVPLNRTATYVVELKWSGALAQIEFDHPETPKLSNFKLAGSSSSNRVGLERGENTAIKTFEYTLKAEGLGMGYVEGLRVGYLDKATNERHTLAVQRLGIKVIEPVREPEDAPYGLAMTAGLLLTILAGLGVWQWEARQKKKELEQLARQATKPLEQEYLERLQAAVDLNSLETRPGFSEVSRLVRQYLQRRFDIPVQGIATTEVTAAYRALDGELTRGIQLEEILQTCDLVKFSGDGGDPARLARVFTLTESFLRAHSSRSDQSQN